MYFDDMPVGYQFTTKTRSFDEASIIAFAREHDPQPFHIDPEAAAASHFGGLVASGFQTMTLGFALVLEAEIWTEASMGAAGIDALRWPRPVRPGDTIFMRGTVLTSEPSKSRPDRGRTRIRYEAINQNGDIVMSYETLHLFKRRPG